MKLILAGGGTGGHLFPGMAVAEEWVARGGQALFVGSQLGMEGKLLPRYGYHPAFIPAVRLKGTGVLDRIKSLVVLPWALLKSLNLLRRERPKVVLGIGGYASGPVVLAAWLMRIPTAIIEQNAIAGFTNRVLGRFAKKIFIAFQKETEFFDAQKCVMTGNPIMKNKRRKGARVLPPSPVLLICGGSQGAQKVNQMVLEALPQVVMEVPDLHVIHQTGTADYEKVKKSYEDGKVSAEVAPFYDDLEKKYPMTSLAIARSGAGSVAELALWGVPSILIPYPHAADDHQRWNAKELATVKGAIVLEQGDMTSDLLARQVTWLLKDPMQLKEMSEGALTLAKPDAAERVVDELMKITKA